jgi:hypothetical protein
LLILALDGSICSLEQTAAIIAAVVGLRDGLLGFAWHEFASLGWSTTGVTAFKALDRLCCCVLHALEDDEAVTWSYDTVVQDFELIANPSCWILDSISRLDD